MVLSPGVQFLAVRIPQLLVGPFIAYILLILVDNLFDWTVGSRGTKLIILFSNPVLVASLLGYNDIKNYLAARSLGVRLPPYIGDWSPGSFFLLKQQMATSKNGYISWCLFTTHQA